MHYSSAWMIAAYPLVGVLGLMFFAHVASRHGDPVITRSDGLLVNGIFVACVVPLMPLVLLAAPFISLHAVFTSRWGRAASDRLPPGFCLRFPEGSTRPTFPVDPLELPAFLRRQAHLPPPARA